MSDEKPLHVRVAEAMGLDGRIHSRLAADGCSSQVLEDVLLIGKSGEAAIPRYDTDWSATGPLIERYCISLTYGECKRHFECKHLWCATNPSYQRDDCASENPLLAVCNLILALGAGSTGGRLYRVQIVLP